MKSIFLNRKSNSEIDDSNGKLQHRRSGSLLVGFALAMVSAGPAIAGPTGGEVVGGEGSITRDGALTQIDQTTGRISINWDTFDVAANETVRFVQPSSSAVALNTIFDQNASQIFGTIDANGRVLLINPNGMIFGRTAQVNVAGLVASSLNISTADFMAGNYSFESAGGSGGLILNQGTLQAAPGGFIALLGEAVANEGLIIADAGTIAMGAGAKVALDFDGSGLLYFEVQNEILDNALGLESAVSNSGSLFADGGQVLLTAAAAQDVYTRAINNDGLIQARRIDNVGGVIRLSGGLGTTVNTGTLDASGDASSDGGSIHVTGNYVGLAGDATLIADGGQSGGQILVGGGYQGDDADVQNAERTYVGSDVSISANAGANGGGGEVVVWSDDVTRYHGSISATGGSESGNGGDAEVSGAQSLGFDGYVDLTAANGETGLLLLDPALLTILGGNGGLPGGDLDGDLPDFAFTDTNGNDAVTADALEALDANIFLRAEDSILIADQGLNGGDGNITIAADRDITLETRNSTAAGDSAGTISFADTTNSIVTQGTGSITITAGTVGTEGASITNTGNLTTAGGDVTLTAAGDITVTADINSNGGAVNITADDNATIAAGATVAAGAGNVDVRVDNADDSADTLAALGGITSTGTVTLAGSSANANDTLQGGGSANTWIVDAANSGSLNGLDFDDFSNLTGGAAADTFNFTVNDDGGLTTLDGAAGNDEVSYVGAGGPVTVAIDRFTNIETLSGSGDANDTLQGSNGADAFTVDGVNSGTAGGTNYSGFENLDGLGGNDSFTLNVGGSVASITGGGGSDTVIGNDAGNAFVINAANAGTANGIGFTGIDNLTGGAAADVFTFTGALTGTAAGLGGDDVFNVGDNGDAGLFDGGSGADSLSYAARTSGATVDMANVDAIESVTGSGFGDTFNLNGDESNDIAIDGGAGSDLFAVISNSQITGDLDVSNVEAVSIDADLSANNVNLAVNGAINQSGGVLSAQTLTTSTVGGQTIVGSVDSFNAINSGGGDISLGNDGDLVVTSIAQTGGGAVSVGTAGNLSQSGGITADGGGISMSASDGSITMAAGTEANSNGGDIDYITTGAGGDITLGTLITCADCGVAGSTGAVTITAIGDILGQANQTHVTAVTAWLNSGGDIGASITPIVFRKMGAGTAIDLQFIGRAFIDSGDFGFTASDLNSVSDVFAATRETAASAQAAAQEEEEEVNWAAYSQDITVYEINNEGVQLPEDEEEDEFVRIKNEGVSVPIASNTTY